MLFQLYVSLRLFPVYDNSEVSIESPFLLWRSFLGGLRWKEMISSLPVGFRDRRLVSGHDMWLVWDHRGRIGIGYSGITIGSRLKHLLSLFEWCSRLIHVGVKIEIDEVRLNLKESIRLLLFLVGAKFDASRSGPISIISHHQLPQSPLLPKHHALEILPTGWTRLQNP